MDWSSLEQAQPIASKILKNSITKNRLAHAYLIQGLRGSGKSEIAMLLTQTLFCPERNGIEPCGVCNVCKIVSSKNYPEVNWIEDNRQLIRNLHINFLRKYIYYTIL